MEPIKINDVNEAMEITEEEINHVKGGGFGLLLPAVQKVTTTSFTDGTSNTLLLGERYK